MSISDPWLKVDLTPDVIAIQTIRGIGKPPYGGFNLGLHVGDDHNHVTENRARVGAVFGRTPVFPQQVHGAEVAVIETSNDPFGEVDAIVTRTLGLPIGIQTADCLPVLFSGDGVIGCAHAGWRGLQQGILENIVNFLGDPRKVTAWLGPCIDSDVFEVGPEVISAFTERDPSLLRFFKPSARFEHAYMDLQGIAKFRLDLLSIGAIKLLGMPAGKTPDRWYSYRFEGVTGRMASCIMRIG